MRAGFVSGLPHNGGKPESVLFFLVLLQIERNYEFGGEKAEDGLTERYPHSRRDLLRSYENPLTACLPHHWLRSILGLI